MPARIRGHSCLLRSWALLFVSPKLMVRQWVQGTKEWVSFYWLGYGIIYWACPCRRSSVRFQYSIYVSLKLCSCHHGKWLPAFSDETGSSQFGTGEIFAVQVSRQIILNVHPYLAKALKNTAFMYRKSSVEQHKWIKWYLFVFHEITLRYL